MTKMVVIECKVKMLTDKAVNIEFPDDKGKPLYAWIPLSLCEAPDTIAKDDEEITIPEWLAEDRMIPY